MSIRHSYLYLLEFIFKWPIIKLLGLLIFSFYNRSLGGNSPTFLPGFTNIFRISNDSILIMTRITDTYEYDVEQKS